MSVVHVYSLMQVIHVSTDYGAPHMNYPVNTSDIKLFRDVRTVLTFYVKDIDRKPVTLSNTTSVHFTMVERDRSDVVLSRALTLVNPDKALYEVAFDATDLIGVELGSYNYSVLTLEGGIYQPLYTDRDRTLHGVAYVVDGPFARPAASTEIDFDQFLVVNSTRARTGSYPGAAAIGDTTGSHQLAIYSEEFTGNVVIEGSLDISPPSDDNDWYEIDRIDLTGVTGLTPFNFEGNHMWVRFALEPAVLSDFSGFTKVLYRN